MDYLKRVVDDQLDEALGYAGGVLIEGVRGCGKTRTAREHAASWVAVDSDDPQVVGALAVEPSLLLAGPRPRLIDEWQVAPGLWNAARRVIDDADAKGQFIFTGSATPAPQANRHSGAHRFTTLRMRPMTLFERGFASQPVSLRRMFFSREDPDFFKPTLEGPDVRGMLDAIAHGGWPGDISTSTAHALHFMGDYLDTVITEDVNRLDDDAQRDPDRMRLILASLARNVAAELNYTTIAADISRSREMSRNTVSQYISVLERLFIVERQQAWTGRVRSKTAIRTSEKLHFVDPALACAMLELDADGLVKDLNTAGLVFETAVFQHLSVFAQPLRGRVYHYRDKAGREVDAVIVLPDGRWGAVEVKLGIQSLPQAESSLLAFRNQVDTAVMGEPSFLAIVTGNGGCMRLESGVYSINLAALAP